MLDEMDGYMNPEGIESRIGGDWNARKSPITLF